MNYRMEDDGRIVKNQAIRLSGNWVMMRDFLRKEKKSKI